jgi:transposase InsO family protein
VTRLCALYGVTPAGYYAWRRRPESAHAEQDRRLSQRIKAVFRAHRGRYGSPRIQRELRAEGWRVSRRRVERLLRAAGLRARVARVYRANPRLHRFFEQHPNRLPRHGARRRDRVWVADITYVPVGHRWHFLAAVEDQYSRRVVAWTLGHRRDARLTRRVLEAAVRRRRPPRGLIFHSDRGSEYSAVALRERLVALGIRQSSAWRGPADNAHMESFFHSLKAELLHGTQFTSVDALRRALQGYIRYYNHHRRHSALDYRSPVDYERGAA